MTLSWLVLCVHEWCQIVKRHINHPQQWRLEVEPITTFAAILDIGHSENTGDLTGNKWRTLHVCRKAFDGSFSTPIVYLSYRALHLHTPGVFIGNKRTAEECAGSEAQIYEEQKRPEHHAPMCPHKINYITD